MTDLQLLENKAFQFTGGFALSCMFSVLMAMLIIWRNFL